MFNCRAEGKIKHCRIKREGRLYTIGTAQFESLVELVEFYMRHPLYKGMKLKYQINEDVRNLKQLQIFSVFCLSQTCFYYYFQGFSLTFVCVYQC